MGGGRELLNNKVPVAMKNMINVVKVQQRAEGNAKKKIE